MRGSALRAALAVLLLAAQARAEWTDWVLDADLAANYESNVNRASDRSEEEWDAAFRLSGQVGRFYQIAERTRLIVAAEVAGEHYADFDDLDAFEAGGQLALLHKLGVGDAPWLRGFASGGHREVRDGERSGQQFAVGLAAASASRRASTRGSATPSRGATRGTDPQSWPGRRTTSSIRSTTT